jgi:hypothetical protein
LHFELKLDRLIDLLLIFVYLDLKTAMFCKETEFKNKMGYNFCDWCEKELNHGVILTCVCKEKQGLQTHKPDILFINLIRGNFHKTSENSYVNSYFPVRKPIYLGPYMGNTHQLHFINGKEAARSFVWKFIKFILSTLMALCTETVWMVYAESK